MKRAKNIFALAAVYSILLFKCVHLLNGSRFGLRVFAFYFSQTYHTAFLSLQQMTQEEMSEDSFFDLLSKFQSRRIDDQRCSFKPTAQSEPKLESTENSLKETGIADSLTFLTIMRLHVFTMGK